MKYISLVFLVFFVFQLLFIIDLTSFNFKNFYLDIYSNSMFSDNLRVYSVENCFFEHNKYFSGAYNVNYPYHYFELWLNALISNISKLYSGSTYYLIMTPIFLSTYFYGVFSIIRFKLKKLTQLYCVLLTFLLLFVTSFFIPFIDRLELEFNPLFNDPSIMGVEFQKLSFSYSIFLSFFILIMLKKKVYAQIVLLSLPVFSIVYAPSIIGGLVFYNIFNYKKKIHRTLLLYTLLIGGGDFYFLSQPHFD